MTENPEGLAFTLERIDTLIQKLDLHEQTCHDQLTRLGRIDPTIRTRINSGVYQQKALPQHLLPRHLPRHKCLRCTYPNSNFPFPVANRSPEDQTAEQRQQRIQELGVCPECFKDGHALRDCRGQPCPTYKKAHNKALCPQNARPTRRIAHAAVIAVPSVANAKVTGATITSSQMQQTRQNVSLLFWLTARVFNYLSSLTTLKAKLFLDQGSQCSSITKKFADRLGLQPLRDSNTVIKSVGEGNGNHYTTYEVTIGITFPDGTKHHLPAYSLPRVTEPFLHTNVSPNTISEIRHQTQKELSLPLYTDEPDILLGSNLISKINPRVLKHLPSGFALYESELGPMIGGSRSVPSQYLSPCNV
ncbi:unnamed protein product [Toxocara canis]|uniref:DUF1758 domain-containing protein n=1 Tax=Toxocara canis TaxID=6265 RepID=A0A183U5C6_TOXCA|nr:unnamed protein product [Toxocara canis]